MEAPVTLSPGQGHPGNVTNGPAQFVGNDAAHWTQLTPTGWVIHTGITIKAVTADWPDVHRLAKTLSKRHTMTGGHRSLDVLHVATALHLGAREFLTFDANQMKLALAEKLKVKP